MNVLFLFFQHFRAIQTLLFNYSFIITCLFSFFLSIDLLLSSIRQSSLVFHDYWLVTLKTEAEGSFGTWSPEEKKMAVIKQKDSTNGGEENTENTKVFFMANYFGLG